MVLKQKTFNIILVYLKVKHLKQQTGRSPLLQFRLNEMNFEISFREWREFPLVAGQQDQQLDVGHCEHLDGLSVQMHLKL